jgi:hypothetical protein
MPGAIVLYYAGRRYRVPGMIRNCAALQTRRGAVMPEPKSRRPVKVNPPSVPDVDFSQEQFDSMTEAIEI